MLPIQWKWKDVGWTGEGMRVYHIQLDFDEHCMDSQFIVRGILGVPNSYWDTLMDAKGVCQLVDCLLADMEARKCTKS